MLRILDHLGLKPSKYDTDPFDPSDLEMQFFSCWEVGEYVNEAKEGDYHPYIDRYMDDCRSGKNIVGKDILLAMDYIEEKLSDPDVFIDAEKIYKAVELMERYFEIKLFDWELFVTALIHCYYKSTDTVVFSRYSQ